MTHFSVADHSGQDERRWQRLCGREQVGSTSTDDFFYGVTTTGVVCRAGCPSRTPRRENVRFFNQLDDALRSGFRACLRCRPMDESFARQTTDRVEGVVRAITEGVAAGRKVSLATLASAAGLSPFHLQRTFQAAVGVTPAQYARRLRAERLDQQLLSGHTATEAIFAAGYQSASAAYGGGNRSAITPGSKQKRGRGELIRYSLSASPLGRMLVAATNAGVCCIAFADTDDALLCELRERFAAAELQEDAAALGVQVSTMLAGLDEPTKAVELPLHIRATAFQDRVWTALRAIPRGETRTYAQVAAGIGQPTAARAVARACASNPVAVVVPCHRVVGSDGALTGYRWGVQRKQKLLEMERGHFLETP